VSQAFAQFKQCLNIFFSIEFTFKKFGQGPNCANVAPLIPINVAAAQARTTSLPDHRVGERTKCINKHQKTTTEKFRLFAALPLSILPNYTIERNAIHELFRAEWCIMVQHQTMHEERLTGRQY